jgi:hypothetical protein
VADVQVVVLPVADGANRVWPETLIEYAKLVIVDSRRDADCGEDVDRLGQLVLVVDRINPN